MHQIQASLIQKGSARALPLFVSLSETGELSFTFDEEHYKFSIAELSVSDKLGSTPREITLPDGAVITTREPQTLELWLQQHSPHNLISRFEQNKFAWLVATVCVPLTIWFIVSVVIPATAKLLVPLIPDVVLEQSSQQSLYALDKTALSASELDEKTKKTLSDTWNQTLEELGQQPAHYQLHFRSSELFGANAFALPDGTVVVTDELVTLLQDAPDAIIAVMLHEIGHVHHQHSMRLITETLATTLVLTYFTGDMQGVAELFSGAALTALQSEFTRDLEQEADDYAFAQLKQLGKSPLAFATAIERITASATDDMDEEDSKMWESLEAYLSTHPLPKERIENAKKAAQ